MFLNYAVTYYYIYTCHNDEEVLCKCVCFWTMLCLLHLLNSVLLWFIMQFLTCRNVVLLLYKYFILLLNEYWDIYIVVIMSCFLC
jgi:hypothetical protein